jgi:hypothetical protein
VVPDPKGQIESKKTRYLYYPELFSPTPDGSAGDHCFIQSNWRKCSTFQKMQREE